MRRAITPGTFDPLTNGHLDIIERAAQLFDEVVVAVAESRKKNPLFAVGDRVELVREATSHLPNVRVEAFSGLLVDFAHSVDARVLVKGLRATTDFEYEFAMTAANYHLDPDLETVFIMSLPKHMHLSSSLVREIASLGGPVDDFVPSCVKAALERRFLETEGGAQASESAIAPAVSGGASVSEAFAPVLETGESRRIRMACYYESAVFEYGFNSLCKMAVPDGLTGKTVLDIGCRRGKGIYKFSERVGQEGRAIGIDWAPDYIADARAGSARALAKNGFARSNMEFHVAYPEDLRAAGIADESVDAVWVNSVFNLFFEPEAALSEAFRVLKEGGMAVFDTVLADGVRDEAVRRRARELGNSIQSSFSFGEFEAMLACAGFSAPAYSERVPVAADQGYKEHFTVPVAEGAEDVPFYAVSAIVRKA